MSVMPMPRLMGSLVLEPKNAAEVFTPFCYINPC
jgi:hypothetical protein